MISVTHT